MRQPPQKSGTGTSASEPLSGKRASASSHFASSASRSGAGRDWSEAQADSREP